MSIKLISIPPQLGSSFLRSESSPSAWSVRSPWAARQSQLCSHGDGWAASRRRLRREPTCRLWSEPASRCTTRCTQTTVQPTMASLHHGATKIMVQVWTMVQWKLVRREPSLLIHKTDCYFVPTAQDSVYSIHSDPITTAKASQTRSSSYNSPEVNEPESSPFNSLKGTNQSPR